MGTRVPHTGINLRRRRLVGWFVEVEGRSLRELALCYCMFKSCNFQSWGMRKQSGESVLSCTMYPDADGCRRCAKHCLNASEMLPTRPCVSVA